MNTIIKLNITVLLVASLSSAHGMIPQLNKTPPASVQSTQISRTTPAVQTAPTTISAPKAVSTRSTAPSPMPTEEESTYEVQMDILNEQSFMAGKPTTFNIYFHVHGKPISAAQLSPIKENQLRFTVIDPSLSEIISLYPTSTDHQGQYQFHGTLQKAGEYIAIAELTDKNGVQHIAHTNFNVTGTNAQSPHFQAYAKPGSLEAHKKLGNLYFSSTTTSKQIHANKLVVLDIAVKNASGKFHKNLQPHMGHYANVIAINAEKDAFIHSTPINNKPKNLKQLGGPDARFKLRFPKPGYYRIFAQFQIDGKFVTVPYDLQVLP